MDEEQELRPYHVTFYLGTQTVTVDAEDSEHAVARATDQLLAQAYAVVGRATITVDESHDVELEL
jgi:hypothetical protein